MSVFGLPSLRMCNFDQTYVEKIDSRPCVLLVEADPILGLDLVDALEAADLHALGPFRRPAEALSLLPYLTMQGVVLGQEQWDGTGLAILRQLRGWGIPTVVHAACPDEPGLVAEFWDVPVLSRPAWADDIVDTVAPLLPARSRP